MQRQKTVSTKFLQVWGADLEGRGMEAVRVARYACEKCGARTEEKIMLECGRTVKLCPACREAFYSMLDSQLNTNNIVRLSSDGNALRGLVDLVELRQGEERQGKSKRVLAHAASFRTANSLSLVSPVGPSREPLVLPDMELVSAVSTPFGTGSPPAVNSRTYSAAKWLFDQSTLEPVQESILIRSKRHAMASRSDRQSPDPLTRLLCSEQRQRQKGGQGKDSPFVGLTYGSFRGQDASPPPLPPFPHTASESSQRPPSPPLQISLDELRARSSSPPSSSLLTYAQCRAPARHGRPHVRPRTVLGGIEAVGYAAAPGIETLNFSLPLLNNNARRSVSPDLRREVRTADGGRRIGQSRREMERAGREVRRAMRVVLSGSGP